MPPSRERVTHEVDAPDAKVGAEVLAEGALEDLLHALLEVAARKDLRRAWPRTAPPEDEPVVARRDADGSLEVSFEGRKLPVGRLAAIALADVDATRAGSVDLLPPSAATLLEDEALESAVIARLSSLRGPPPHVPLRRLVSDYGGDAVEWTAVCAGDPGELILLLTRGDVRRLVIVPTATSAAASTTLLRTLAPLPAERSLWRFLEQEGPRLLSVPGLELASLSISSERDTYGLAIARIPGADVSLPVDLPRFVDVAWPTGDALARVERAAGSWRDRLARERPTVEVLRGAAVLRVLARAASGNDLERSAEPLHLRAVVEGVALADMGVLTFTPDAVRLHKGPVDIELMSRNGTVDGDTDAWHAFVDVLDGALAAAALPRLSWAMNAELAWKPGAYAAESSEAFQLALDRFVDAGPVHARSGGKG